MEIIELLKIAYKKLKSSVYYDKTQLILRQELVKWEVEHNVNEDDNKFINLSNDLINDFESLCSSICDGINCRVFPKTLEHSKTEDSNVLFNFTEKDITVKELQYFIDMDVKGHILGVLWLMMAGYKIDEQIYEHSYGNRIRKNLRSEFSNECTYSPYLFEPYFQQYESWRDKALDQALWHLKSNQDVAVITMDFKRYYYSVDMNDEVKKQIIDNLEINSYSDENRELVENLSEFIFKVFDVYSKKCAASEGRTILPIGFLPSNVLSNWYLNAFDKAVSDGWNPIYYGRYVDDILIIDKVEKNSDLYEKAAKGIIKRDDIISLLLTQCSKWCGMNKELSSQENALLIEDKEETKKAAAEEPDVSQIIYRVNPKYHSKGNGKILLQNSKVNIFYFKSGESDALITCFKKKIAINASEFRHMPDDETFYSDDDYGNIYHLVNEESPNKFRGIKSISLDKYELSKFLSKHLRIGSMISDRGEYQFINDINIIFTPRIIIRYYDMWERIIEAFVVDNSFSAAVDFINKVLNSISSTNLSDDNKNTLSEMQETLYSYLYSAICRAFSLVWGPKVAEAIKSIDIGSDFPFSKDDIKLICLKYLKTKMMDKSVMPIFIDLIEQDKLNNKFDVNLTRFQDAVSHIKKDNWKSKYRYYPYIISMYDISIISSLEQMKKDSENFRDITGMIKSQANRFVKYNFCPQKKFKSYILEDMVKAVYIRNKTKNKKEMKKTYLVSAGSFKKSSLKIAVANVSLSYDNFDKLIKGNPNRSYKRYKELVDVVNAAIDQHADMLVMPESYVPFEWLTILARTCAKSNMAVVTGVEHIVFDKKVFNLTAVILPFINRKYNYSCANICFHLKNYLSPQEKELIRGYRLNGIEGNTYELYKWNDCYFPVYCCYELASVRDRAIFQSYADFLVAIEWNKDTNYYSNILESLSRDIHCYCVQVNSSEYGDSRITKPSKTEEMDILRTKGGINSTILVGQIDIGKLRSFQIKENNLQQKSHDFKMTPPEFDAEIVLNKIKGDVLGNNQ